MAKITLKGIIHEVGNIEYVGEKEYPKQFIIIFVPEYVDEYGEKKGKDEHWQVTLFGNNVDKFNIQPRNLNAKVKVDLYLKSMKYEGRDGKIGYMINADLASIEYVAAKPQDDSSPVPDSVAANPDDDDLPF